MNYHLVPVDLDPVVLSSANFVAALATRGIACYVGAALAARSHACYIVLLWVLLFLAVPSVGSRAVMVVVVLGVVVLARRWF